MLLVYFNRLGDCAQVDLIKIGIKVFLQDVFAIFELKYKIMNTYVVKFTDKSKC